MNHANQQRGQTDQQRAYQAIKAGHQTTEAIIEATGLSVFAVRTYLARLKTAGSVYGVQQGRATLYKTRGECLLADVWRGIPGSAEQSVAPLQP